MYFRFDFLVLYKNNEEIVVGSKMDPPSHVMYFRFV